MNGDSSSSEKVQSFPQRRNAYHCAQEFHELDWEKEIKRDILKFSGTDSVDEIVDWLILVNKVFEYKKVLNDRRIGIIVMRFQSKIITWWR